MSRGHPLILTERWSVTREYIVKEFRKRGIPMGDCIHCENVSAIKQMVHFGLGGSFFPYYAIEEDIREGRYRSVEILDDLFLNIDLIYVAKRRIYSIIKLVFCICFLSPKSPHYRHRGV